MEEYKRFAIETAKEAGKLLMDNLGKIQELEYKLKTNFRTKVDTESDKLIREAIIKRFPDHNIYSEEKGGRNNSSEFSWVVDPLDGTLPYTLGISDHFSVSIALVKGKTPVLGVIYAPKRKELYVAEQGKGAFCNGSRMNTSQLDDINKAMIALDYGKFEREKVLDFQRRLLSNRGVTYTVSYACASVSLALVASGKLHGYLALKLEPWDMAAAVVLNREAGGRVTNISGKEWELGDESILTANQGLHKKLLESICSKNK